VSTSVARGLSLAQVGGECAAGGHPRPGGEPSVAHRLAQRVLQAGAHPRAERAQLYALNAWRETPFFDSRKRAALAFCEAVVRTSDTHVPQAAWGQVAAAFTEDEAAALISLIISINAWNAVGVSTHTWRPGSYEV
jgi:hypothetical protein